MKRTSILLVLTILVAVLLTGCQCKHEWTQASCEVPKTCTKCGETEGEALGHNWAEATCTEAKHCSVCDKVEGEPLEHTWVEVTCAEAKHCSLCGKTDGEPLAHTLTEANYQDAATCTVCGSVVGEPLMSYFEEYGIKCNVELEKTYEFKNPATKNPDKIVKGEYRFLGENSIPPDDSLEELEGYEWKRVWIDLSVPESEAKYGFFAWTTWEFDYYEMDQEDATVLSSGEDSTFSVNWHGKKYSECKDRYTIIQNTYITDDKTNKTEWSYIVEWAVRVPVGYDGIVVGVSQMTPEKQDLLDNHPEEVHAHTMIDENSYAYRMK